MWRNAEIIDEEFNIDDEIEDEHDEFIIDDEESDIYDNRINELRSHIETKLNHSITTCRNLQKLNDTYNQNDTTREYNRKLAVKLNHTDIPVEAKLKRSPKGYLNESDANSNHV